VEHDGVTCYSCDNQSWFNPKKLSCTSRANCEGNTYYNATEGSCLFCPYFCSVCNYDDTNPVNNNITCLSCTHDGWFTANTSNCEIRSNCHNGTFYDADNNSCYDCPEYCLDCFYDESNVGNVTCTSCEDEWNYQLNDAGRCISKHD